jgi:hypothetical protein
VEGRYCLLEVVEVMEVMCCASLAAVEGRFCLPEVLEVLEGVRYVRLATGMVTWRYGDREVWMLAVGMQTWRCGSLEVWRPGGSL